ncbi:MAG: hypothetical protein ISS56_01940 [Anaerolineae bacterium]|nr:hypothetical protein [Anaerolineae bacterium]
MTQSLPRRTYRTIIGVLALVTVGVLGCAAAVLIANRPPSPAALAATMTAMPSPTPTLTPTPTPAPTVPGVSSELLVCQSKAGYAMNDRRMVGAVNISDDHLFRLAWVSLDWEIEDLDDALPGVIMGFDVALDVWAEGCAVYDRVQIEVYERRDELQIHRMDVQAQMDDLIQWRAGGLNDQGLVARLLVTPS